MGSRNEFWRPEDLATSGSTTLHLLADLVEAGELRRIRGELHLAHQRKHVRRQSRLQQDRGLIALVPRMRLAFRQHVAQVRERTEKNGDRSLVHRKGVAHRACPGEVECEDSLAAAR